MLDGCVFGMLIIHYFFGKQFQVFFFHDASCDLDISYKILIILKKDNICYIIVFFKQE